VSTTKKFNIEQKESMNRLIKAITNVAIISKRLEFEISF